MRRNTGAAARDPDAGEFPMTATAGLDTFDTTVQETNLWLKSMMHELRIDDGALAWTLLGAALHALRDRLQPQSAAHLGAQLPMLIRGLYYEHWSTAANNPNKERHKAQFLQHLAAGLPPDAAVDPERAVRAVFGVMREKIDQGEVAKLVKMLPRELRGLWEAE
jgi:uncharacterized protein (DUF2267 family)